jgi:hypothetical protein
MSMPVRLCRVSIRDLQGVEHSVEVTAGTLYEAVALGLATIRSEQWASEIADELNVAKVSAVNIPVEYFVTLTDFNAWVKRTSGSPREIIARRRTSEILGIVANK